MFIDSYPEDVPLADVTERALMALRCHFITAAALISLARAEEELECQLQHYIETRHHVAAYDALCQTEVASQDEMIISDLMSKLSSMLVFDFESAICLRSWDNLTHIIRKGKFCKDEVMYKAMGDCLLRSRAPGKCR